VVVDLSDRGGHWFNPGIAHQHVLAGQTADQRSSLISRFAFWGAFGEQAVVTTPAFRWWSCDQLSVLVVVVPGPRAVLLPALLEDGQHRFDHRPGEL
jgi:hypothetical protein